MRNEKAGSARAIGGGASAPGASSAGTLAPRLTRPHRLRLGLLCGWGSAARARRWRVRAQAAEDTEPPVLESLSISPATVNTTSSVQTVTVLAHITDTSQAFNTRTSGSSPPDTTKSNRTSASYPAPTPTEPGKQRSHSRASDDRRARLHRSHPHDPGGRDASPAQRSSGSLTRHIRPASRVIGHTSLSDRPHYAKISAIPWTHCAASPQNCRYRSGPYAARPERV
jgi:hypothetical protein